MDDQVREFFEWLAPNLLHGDLDWLEDVYDYPLSIFVEDQIRLERSLSDTITYLMSRREHAARHGITAMSADLIQVQWLTDGKKFSAVVEYVFHSQDGSEFGRNRSIYLCRFDDEERIKVESVEILKVGLPFAPGTSIGIRH